MGEGGEGGDKGEYSAILYRKDRFTVDASGTFWLSDTPEVPSRHWSNECIRVCTWARLVDIKSKKAFYMFNTHLDHVSQYARERGVRLIIERMVKRAHQDPVVLTGDLNAGENNPVIHYLKGANGNGGASPLPLVDTFRVLHPDEQPAGTSSGFSGKRDGAKIDYVFVLPGTKVLGASIIRTSKDGRYPSDHFPVKARVMLQNS